MRNARTVVLGVVCLLLPLTAPLAEDLSGTVRKLVQKSTLDQEGTTPFHLKATFAPGQNPGQEPDKQGEIEYWWTSPTRWRREIRSPHFNQTLIVNNGKQWQRNDSDYLPQWLNNLAVELVRPVPVEPDELATYVKTAEVRHLAFRGTPISTNIQWAEPMGVGPELGQEMWYLDIKDDPGIITLAMGRGFSAELSDYVSFDRRNVPRTIGSGGVTAKIMVLEKLGETPKDFFDTNLPNGDANPIVMITLMQAELEKNLMSANFQWPAVENGPFEGLAGTEITVDRNGKVRELGMLTPENPALKDAAEAGLRSMQFKPFVRDGMPVEVTGRFVVRFKTHRPAGEETFDTAKNYFARGRQTNYLAAAAKAPYHLTAEFTAGTASGLQTGKYEDTWLGASEWRREASVGNSRVIRTQSGDHYYRLADGSEVYLLLMVLRILEPIPAEDTMTESDWQIRRDTVDGAKTIRVARGEQEQNGDLKPSNAEGFWFDESNRLVKCVVENSEIRLTSIEQYDGVPVPRLINVYQNGKPVMRIQVREIAPADPAKAGEFKIKGHEWKRAFTAEVR